MKEKTPYVSLRVLKILVNKFLESSLEKIYYSHETIIKIINKVLVDLHVRKNQ